MYLDAAAEGRVLPAVSAGIGADPPEYVIVLDTALVLKFNTVGYTLLESAR